MGHSFEGIGNFKVLNNKFYLDPVLGRMFPQGELLQNSTYIILSYLMVTSP